MPLKPACLAVLVGAGMFAAAPLRADEIRLRNGDRITGAVLHKDGSAVVVRTNYAGELHVRWDEVVGITTAGPILLQAQGSADAVRVRLLPAKRGRVGLAPPVDGDASLALEQVAFLNPTPEESARGIVYKGRVNISSRAARGNTNSWRLNGEVDFTGEDNVSRFALGLRGDQEKARDARGTAKWRAIGEYDRFIEHDRFLYARTSLEHNRLLDIAPRATIGFGHGWQLVQSLDTALSLRSGLDYVVIRRADDDDERYPALGWGIKYRHRLFGRRLEFFHEHDGYLNLQRHEDLTLISRTGMRLPILPGLYATSQLNFNWDGHPPAARDPLDASVLFGVGYEW